MVEVVVAAVILEDEDMDPLEMDVIFMEADKVPLRKDLMDAVITSPRSVGRNLVELSGHNYLILILLPRVVLLRTLHPSSWLFHGCSITGRV